MERRVLQIGPMEAHLHESEHVLGEYVRAYARLEAAKRERQAAELVDRTLRPRLRWARRRPRALRLLRRLGLWRPPALVVRLPGRPG